MGGTFQDEHQSMYDFFGGIIQVEEDTELYPKLLCKITQNCFIKFLIDLRFSEEFTPYLVLSFLQLMEAT